MQLQNIVKEYIWNKQFSNWELRKNKSSFRKFYQHMVDVVLANETLITKNLMKMKCDAKIYKIMWNYL